MSDLDDGRSIRDRAGVRQGSHVLTNRGSEQAAQADALLSFREKKKDHILYYYILGKRAETYITPRWAALFKVVAGKTSCDPFAWTLPYALAGGVAIFAALLTLWAYLKRHKYWPFLGTLLLFVASFIGLVASLYPYAIIPALTWSTGAASFGTQLFMLVGILPLIPIMLFYNGYQYLVFSSKVEGTAYSDDEGGQ